ncbi:SUMF1/EgtB/PvdO family nonheme iron enzyme [Caballeronia sp. LZ028]|uniref:formylglycine-generating enzyme family protein n=1 Tax=Caballeronia sp. LZ028 TaxID=3038563 RepID=UPI00285FE5F5|nr:SUMF1/EgtB/PvdO family nonheme iron enzyme [Caballeronia sp. LZ028]MDR5769107.1 SUMF1/EgtB/PvdO family nonheme iron enzyme [Caballeronia sp. LZ028]
MKPRYILTCAFVNVLFASLAIGQTTVKPPKMPAFNNVTDDTPYDDKPLPQQSVALKTELMNLTEGTVSERIVKLKAKVLKDLVYVKGGTFMMGDFGPLWIPGGGGYYTTGFDNKPPHKVTLTGFSIMRYKATYAELDVFSDATGQPRAGMDWKNGRYRHPLIPAGMYWQRAKDYCTWLGEQMKLPVDLPTEAQWEYAARSGGQFFIWATDNGNLDRGRNIASYKQADALEPITWVSPDDPETVAHAGTYPVGIYPPNPIGLYDMNANGVEWLQDWYDPEYYSHSPERDPRGPATGSERVLRGQRNGGSYERATNVRRKSRDPMLLGQQIDYRGEQSYGPGINIEETVRCAVNLERPVNTTH